MTTTKVTFVFGWIPYCALLFVLQLTTGLGQYTNYSNGLCDCYFVQNTSSLSLRCDPNASMHEVSKCFHKHRTAEILSFTDSFLTSIPTEISILKHLNYLDMSRNRLVSLDLKPLKHVCGKLETLILDENDIQTLTKGSMDCLTSLRKFHIVNNSVSIIENGTFNDNLKVLEYIYLMHNFLTTLDASVVILPNLLHNNHHVRVNASCNSISILTNSLNATIQEIYPEYTLGLLLTHNNFTTIDIQYYFKLFNITHPTQAFRLWDSEFDLRFNPFLCDCYMEPLAEILRFCRHMDPDNPVFSITCAQPSSLSGKLIYSVKSNQFNCSVSNKCPRGCSCVETVKLQLISVHCDDNYISSTLPDEVPGFKDIHINIKSGTLTKLSARQYMKNTTALDVSGCAVDTISTDVLQQISRTGTVRLHDNALSRMPREIEEVKFTGLKTLTLHGNPFLCDCHSLWLKKWLIIHRSYIPDIDRVLCSGGPGKGHPIIDAKDSDFKCLYPITTKELLLIISSVVFLLIVTFILLHRNRLFLQVLLIAYCNVHCFRRKAAGQFDYDVFISHSSKDDDWVIETLIKRLESQTPPYKVFFDERDFLPGKTIVYNVIRAIKSSNTTLLVLTNNFLRSDWCMLEFKQAYLQLLKDNDINFIVIVMEELEDSLIGQELKFYLKTNVYVKHSDKYFWPKLLQALPLAMESSDSSPETRQPSERSPLLVNC